VAAPWVPAWCLKSSNDFRAFKGILKKGRGAVPWPFFWVERESSTGAKTMADKGNPTPEALGIKEPEGGIPEGSFDDEMLEKFVKGEITLAEIQGVDGESQTKLANMGHTLLTSGKLEEARQIFEGLVAMNPREAYFLMAAGSVAQQQERLEDADHWYSLALERDGNNPVALANRGEVRMQLERIEDAANDLIEAVKQDPKAAEPTTKRAQALLIKIREELEKIAN
jgi:tetratricopeptide (TPR) repeat protein